MNIYSEIMERGYLTESLSKLIFKDESTRKNSLKSYARTQTARRICIFYSALVQAYVTAKCVKDNVTLKEHKTFKKLAPFLNDVWSGKRDFAVGKTDCSGMSEEEREGGKKIVFSFLDSCAQIEDGLLVKKVMHKEYNANTTTLLTYFGTSYHMITREGYPDTTSAETFVEFIASLPLLAKTELKGNKLVFNVNGEVLETGCSPFFFFSRGEGYDETLCEMPSENCLVLTSVEKGAQDNELKFILMNVASADVDPKPRTYELRIRDREDIRFVCNVVGIETKWYKEEYWCEFKYIKRLAESTSKAVKSYVKEYVSKGGAFAVDRNADVKEIIRKLFSKTDLEAVVRNEKSILRVNIESFIYKLFITQGIFKTIRCLLTEPNGNTVDCVGERLFQSILNTLAEQNEELNFNKLTQIKMDCEEQIQLHEKKLRKVVLKESPPYLLRMIEIIAEQRAIAIIKAAGLQGDNLVEDEESLVSIDDYFDMLKNTEHSLEENLKSILKRLNCFYGALLKNDEGAKAETYSFNEEKYYQDLKEISLELKKKIDEFPEQGLQVVSMLFERLWALRKEVVYIDEYGNRRIRPIINKVLGRDSLFDEWTMENFKDCILHALEKKDESSRREGTLVESPIYGRKVFISYSRADNDKESGEVITQFVEACKEKNMDIFFDVQKIETNEDWEKRLKSEIVDPKCCCVCLFLSKNSMMSEFVGMEVETAMAEAEKRFPVVKGENAEFNDKMRHNFIVTVNLGSDDPQKMYDELAKHLKDTKKQEQLNNLEKFKEIVRHQTVHVSQKEAVWDCFIKQAKWMDQDTELDEVAKRRINKEYSDLEMWIGKFYEFLKFGDNQVQNANGRRTARFEDLENAFYDMDRDMSKCVFPMLAAVKERRIKRDNISVIGYEIVNGAGRANKKSNYILTSKKLDVDEYYCIPNYKTVGDKCEWMVEPLLVSYKKFSEVYPEDE